MNVNKEVYLDSAEYWKLGRANKDILEYTHIKNGLRVYLMPSALKNGVVSFNVAYDVGSKFENDHEKGSAHFLEHALFQGTGTWGFQSSGANINAMTQNGLTNFYATLPSSELHGWIENEAGRMRHTHFTDAMVLKEARVVRNEMEISESNPMSLLYSGMLKTSMNMFTTIGVRKDIMHASAASLNSFWEKHYTSNRAAIICSGDLPGGTSKTLDAIHKHFGDIQPSMETHSPSVIASEQRGIKTFMIDTLSTPANIVTIGIRAPPASMRDSVVMCLISKMVNDENGRAAPILKSGLFYQLSASNSQFRDNNLWMVTAGIPQVDIRAQQLGVQALLELVESFKTSPPSNAELNSAIEDVRRDYELRGMSNTEKAMKVNQFMCRTFNAFHGHECETILNTITAADVHRVSNAFFIESGMTIGRYFPATSPSKSKVLFKTDNTSIQDQFKKISQYSSSPPLRVDSEKTSDKTLLPSGSKPYNSRIQTETYNKKALTVHFVHKPLDIYTYATISMMGAGIDCVNTNHHVVSLLGNMMLDGVQNGERVVNKEAIGKILRDNRIDLCFSASHGSFDVHIKCPQENTNVAFGLSSHMIEYPLLQAENFGAIKSAYLASIHGKQCSVDAQATSLLFNSMFPEDHPNYKMLLENECGSIRALTHEDILNFHKSFVSAPRVMTMFSPSKEHQSHASVFTPINMDASISFERAYKPRPLPLASQNITMVIPDKTSVAFRMGKPIDLQFDDPDFLALQIATGALAGGFGTRLMDVIRDQEGLTYGISGRLVKGNKNVHNSSTFVISSSCNPKLLKQLKDDTLDVVREFLTDGIEGEELSDQKAYEKGSRKVQNDKALNELNMIHYNAVKGSPSNVLDTYASRVDAITVEQVNRVIRKHLKLNEFSIVSVGSLLASDSECGRKSCTDKNCDCTR